MQKDRQQKTDQENKTGKSEKDTEEKMEEIIICPNCNQKADLIWVHGHYQCSKCNAVIISCCNGESDNTI